MNELNEKLEQLQDLCTDMDKLIADTRKLCDAEVARLEALV